MEKKRGRRSSLSHHHHPILQRYTVDEGLPGQGSLTNLLTSPFSVLNNTLLVFKWIVVDGKNGNRE